MIRSNIFASYTFRYTFAYITGLSFAVFVLLAIVYAFFSYSYSQQVYNDISSELDGVEHSFNESGVAGVQQYFDSAVQRGDFTHYFYMLADEDYNKLSGNLDAWPQFTRYQGGWLCFEFDILHDNYPLSSHKSAISSRQDFVGRSLTLDNGYHIIVARHYADVIHTTELVIGILVRGMLVTIVLGTIAGALISRVWLRRVEKINHNIMNIMNGDLNQRIEVDGRNSPDIQKLIVNFNAMLDELQNSMEGIRRVSDNIAHDLRTPLTRLRNRLELLSDKVEPHNQDEVYDLIDEADSLLNTFSALLRITRIESAQQREGFGKVDAATILADVVELYEPLAEDKQQQIIFEAHSRPILYGDRDMLFQSWVNLVDNAIKYTQHGGIIKVSLNVVVEKDEHNTEQRFARIFVDDNGQSIAEDERENAFRRFYRVEASRGLVPGNGLGLSLIAAIVHLHRGEINLLSNNPGLRVQLDLPLARDD